MLEVPLILASITAPGQKRGQPTVSTTYDKTWRRPVPPIG